MKASVSVGLVALAISLAPSFSAASNIIPVSHQPVKALWNTDDTPICYNFLKQRFVEKSNDALNFKRHKRSLSRSDAIHDDENNRLPSLSDLTGGVRRIVHGVLSGSLGNVVDGMLGDVEDTLDSIESYTRNGWMHDKKFGVVLAKTEDNEADNEFLVNVSFGTPGQTLKMVLDTGSPEAWVYSPACCYANNHTFFDPSKSSTFTNRTFVKGVPVAAPKGTPGQDFNVAYSSGTATQGYVGIDTFGFENGKFKVPGLSLGLATDLTGSRKGREMDGLIGLATGNGTTVDGGWTTAFEAMSQRGMLKQTYLTASLVKADRKTGKDGGGQYVFGEVDRSLLAGDVVWTKVLSAYFWAAYVQKMNVGNVVLAQGNGTTSNPVRYIVDTGTAIISMPPVMAKAANKKIFGSYRSDSDNVQLPWLVPCDTGLKRYERSLPHNKRNKPLQITIEGTQFSMPLEDYVFFPQYPVPASEAGGRKNMCYSAIQEGLTSVTVLGLSWIKNHVVVFDQGGPGLDKRRMAFGKRKDVKYDI
ncbi:hypothetical protein ACQY0O_006912 [Thecaphora frezii]